MLVKVLLRIFERFCRRTKTKHFTATPERTGGLVATHHKHVGLARQEMLKKLCELRAFAVNIGLLLLLRTLSKVLLIQILRIESAELFFYTS